MSNEGVTNIIEENFLMSFRERLGGVKTIKTLCFGSFNPLSRKSCEIISVAYESVNRHNFVSNKNPIVMVPIFKKLFEDKNVWESTVCGLSNHKKVDYVIDVEACEPINVVERIVPDFVFIDRNFANIEFIESFCKKRRFKTFRV